MYRLGLDLELPNTVQRRPLGPSKLRARVTQCIFYFAFAVLSRYRWRGFEQPNARLISTRHRRANIARELEAVEAFERSWRLRQLPRPARHVPTKLTRVRRRNSSHSFRHS